MDNIILCLGLGELKTSSDQQEVILQDRNLSKWYAFKTFK